MCEGFLEEVDIDDFGYVTMFQISVDYMSVFRKAVFSASSNQYDSGKSVHSIPVISV